MADTASACQNAGATSCTPAVIHASTRGTTSMTPRLGAAYQTATLASTTSLGDLADEPVDSLLACVVDLLHEVEVDRLAASAVVELRPVALFALGGF